MKSIVDKPYKQALVFLSIFFYLVLGLSCAKKDLGDSSKNTDWGFTSNVEVPRSLVKLSQAGCLQIQTRLGTEVAKLGSMHRLVASSDACPSGNEKVKDSTVRFVLDVQSRQQGSFDLGEKNHELGFIERFKLAHFCQFSNPEQTVAPFDNFFPSYYRSVCEVKFDEQTGGFLGLERFSVRKALAFSNTRASHSEEEAALAFLQRKEAQKKAQDQEGRLHDLEKNMKAEDLIEALQDSMDALRSTLGLAADATPELINVEITKLLTQSRTLQREKEDLIARLGLEKDTSFEKLIKVLQAIKKADPN